VLHTARITTGRRKWNTQK